jgi:hypothetical protein
MVDKSDTKILTDEQTQATIENLVALDITTVKDFGDISSANAAQLVSCVPGLTNVSVVAIKQRARGETEIKGAKVIDKAVKYGGSQMSQREMQEKGVEGVTGGVMGTVTQSMFPSLLVASEVVPGLQPVVVLMHAIYAAAFLAQINQGTCIAFARKVHNLERILAKVKDTFRDLVMVSELEDAIKDGLDKVESYAERGFLSRLLTFKTDPIAFNFISGKIAEFVNYLNLELTTEVRACQSTPGEFAVDTALFEFLEARGGEDAVDKIIRGGDQKTIAELQGHLGIDMQVLQKGIDYRMEQLSKQMAQQTATIESMREITISGVWDVIKVPEMRLFFFRHRAEEIPAQKFIDYLYIFITEKLSILWMGDPLDAGRENFRRLICELDIDGDGRISAIEVRKAFPDPEVPFETRLKQIVSCAVATRRVVLPGDEEFAYDDLFTGRAQETKALNEALGARIPLIIVTGPKGRPLAIKSNRTAAGNRP